MAGSSIATASTPSTPPPACAAARLDLLSDAGWWQTPLWQYALFAVVIYSRAAAERLAVPVEEVARQIAARHDLQASV
ncbi:hypothetical protein ACI79T_11800 [Blastococcus sp. SYSU DS0619]